MDVDLLVFFIINVRLKVLKMLHILSMFTLYIHFRTLSEVAEEISLDIYIVTLLILTYAYILQTHRCMLRSYFPVISPHYIIFGCSISSGFYFYLNLFYRHTLVEWWWETCIAFNTPMLELIPNISMKHGFGHLSSVIS